MIVTFVSHDQVNLIRTKCRLENMLQSNCLTQMDGCTW